MHINCGWTEVVPSDLTRTTGSARKRCSGTHSCSGTKIPPAIRGSSDGRDIGRYGNASGAAPVGSGMSEAQASGFRIAKAERTTRSAASRWRQLGFSVISTTPRTVYRRATCALPVVRGHVCGAGKFSSNLREAVVVGARESGALVGNRRRTVTSVGGIERNNQRSLRLSGFVTSCLMQFTCLFRSGLKIGPASASRGPGHSRFRQAARSASHCADSASRGGRGSAACNAPVAP